MNTDPISDMLNRIRTAQAVKKLAVDIPFSAIKYEIASCMQKEGFIEKAIKKRKQSLRYLRVLLKYEDGEPVINQIRRVSSPGQRIYAQKKELHNIKGGPGVSIVSTSKGVMTNKEARMKGLGGEVLCEIW